MLSTPVSLLERLREPDPAEAWGRFVDLYTPLIYHWAKKLGLKPPDISDFVQDIFTLLVREMPTFEYRPDKRFHGWLWTIVKNKWLERGRKAATRPVMIDDAKQLADAETLDSTLQVDEAEYRKYLVDRALQLMQTEFQATTWRACWESVVHERPANEVATELGISVNAVYVACSRVLRRLRQELDGLLD
jgi:RNA polymerase sigma-70 factor (ECF subfamily)